MYETYAYISICIKKYIILYQWERVEIKSKNDSMGKNDKKQFIDKNLFSLIYKMLCKPTYR